jgi:hypothetical protein
MPTTSWLPTIIPPNRCNPQDDAFAAALAQSGLASSSILTVLDLSDNRIGCAGTTALAAALEGAALRCGLRQLDLGFNCIGSRGATALAGMLQMVPSLAALELEGNQVGWGGCGQGRIPDPCLGRRLGGQQQCPYHAHTAATFPAVYLTHRCTWLTPVQVGDAGALALAEALKATPNLQRVNLNHCRLTGRALMAVGDVLLGGPGVLDCSSGAAKGVPLGGSWQFTASRLLWETAMHAPAVRRGPSSLWVL